MNDPSRPVTGYNRRNRASSAPRQRPHSVHGKSGYSSKRQTLKVRQYRPEFPNGVQDVAKQPNFLVRPKVLNYTRWVDERQRIGTKNSSQGSKTASSVTPGNKSTSHIPRTRTARSEMNQKSSGQKSGGINSENGEVVLDRVNMDRANLREIPILGTEHRGLKLLNLQYNQILRISNLRFFPDLIFLDLYHNQVRKFSGLENCPKLKALMLGKNQIQKMEGLDHIPRLDVLDLHQNRILRMEGLDSLVHLRILNLAGNRIKKIEKLSGLSSLVELNLKKNRIESILNMTPSYFERHTPNLQRVFLSLNRIRKFSSIQPLLKGCLLTEFSLDGNPIANHPLYRNYLVEHVSTLRKIDSRVVSEEEKKNMFQKRRGSGKSKSRQKVDKNENKEIVLSSPSSKKAPTIEERKKNRSSVGVVQHHVELKKKNISKTEESKKPEKQKNLKPFNIVESLKSNTLVITSPLTDIEQSHYYSIVQIVVFTSISFSQAAELYFVKLRKFSKLYQIRFDGNQINFLAELNRLSILGDRITDLHIEPNNTVTKIPIETLRDYCIIVMPNLKILNGKKVGEIGNEVKVRKNVFEKLDRFDKRFEILGGIGGSKNVAGGKPKKRDWEIDMFKEDVKVYLDNIFEHSMTIYRKMRVIDRQWEEVVEKIILETIENM